MKKTYVKPTLNLESFVMTQSIAHNCGASLDFSNATLKYKGQCGWDLQMDGVVNQNIGGAAQSFDVLFMSNPSCTMLTGETETVCYNNPKPEFAVFNS